MTRKRFFTGVEILIGVLVLGIGVSGFKNYKDNKTIKEIGAENVKRAEKIDQLQRKVETSANTLLKTEAAHEQKKKEIREDVAEGFSILYEQALDINIENQTEMTDAHVKTAKGYVDVWGYQVMAKLLKWQSEMIAMQQAETKKLLEQEEQLRLQFEAEKKTLNETIATQSATISDNKVKAIEAKAELDRIAGENGFFSLWWGRIKTWGPWVVLAVIFVNLGGAGWLLKLRSDAVDTAQHYRRKKNSLVKAVKTFSAVDSEGNNTMQNIIDSSDDLDMEEEPEDESPVKTLKRKKKLPPRAV